MFVRKIVDKVGLRGGIMFKTFKLLSKHCCKKQQVVVAPSVKSYEKEFNLLKTLFNNLSQKSEIRDEVISAWHTIKENDSDVLLIQNYLLYLLENFDKICRENNLKYFLRGGSLLGAIRHSGFIPWDDDIDIGMMRNDFDKLVKVLADTDFEISYYFNNTSRKWNCQLPRFVHKYNGIRVFIDIFAFDYTEKNEEDAILEYNQKRDVLWDNMSKLVSTGEVASYIGTMLENYSGDIEKLKSVYEKEIKHGQEQEKNIIYPFDWFDTTQRLYFNTDDLFPLQEIMFANKIKVYIPKNYDVALQACYKNYLGFPNKLEEHKDTHQFMAQKKDIVSFLQDKKQEYVGCLIALGYLFN